MKQNEIHQIWIEQFKAVLKSELSVYKWSIQNGISPNLMNRRLKRLRQLGLISQTGVICSEVEETKSSNSSFVEIPVTDSSLQSVKANSSEIVCKIEFANKASVSITNSISPLLLQKILEVIKC